MKLQFKAMTENIGQIFGPARFVDQFLYGHREILVRYFGLPTESFLYGHLQHGIKVYPTSAASTLRRLTVNRNSCVIFWSSSQLVNTERKLLGNKIFCIGAPWLYLLRMLTGSDRIFPDQVKTSMNNIIFYPEKVALAYTNSVEHARYRAEKLRHNYPDAKITVCLDLRDLMDNYIRDLYSEYNFEITSNGWPFTGNIGGEVGFRQDLRTSFLINSFKNLLSSDLVVSDGLSTPLLYAISLGLPIHIFGHEDMSETIDRYYSHIPEKVLTYEKAFYAYKKREFEQFFIEGQGGFWDENLRNITMKLLGYEDFLKVTTEVDPKFLEFFKKTPRGQIKELVKGKI